MSVGVHFPDPALSPCANPDRLPPWTMIARRQPRRSRAPTLVFLLAAVLAVAVASSVAVAAGFPVSVTVLPTQAPPSSAAAAGLPEPARQMHSDRAGSVFQVEHPPGTTADHVRRHLPERGWHLQGERRLDERTLEQTWVRQDDRIRIRFETPLGGLGVSRVAIQTAP